MNKKYIIFIGTFLILVLSIYAIISVIRSLRMQEDIEGYLDSHFSDLHDDEFYKVSDSPYFIYAGYQRKTDIPSLYIYHYADSDLAICGAVLITHDGYIDKGDYMIEKGESKDLLFFGKTGISFIILKIDKDVTIDYNVEDDSVRVNEVTYFENEDFIVFYYYGSLEDNKSVIVEGEIVFFE